MTPPKNCQECRKWTKSQVDEKKSCKCGAVIRLPAAFKISFHKKEGPFVPPEECRRCLDGNRSPKGTKKRLDKKKREEEKEKEKPSEFATLKRGVPPQPRALVKDGPYYTGLIPGKTETRLEHLEHHIPGSSHDWTTAKLAAQDGQRSSSSPSAFASGTDYRGLIANAQTYFNTADGERVREYAQHKRIYRVTLLDNHDRLEITIIESVPGGNYGLVSTFDDETATYVKRQGWYN